MADTDSNAFTKKLGPLPVWVWMLLVFGVALAWAYVNRGKKAQTADQQQGMGGQSQAMQTAGIRAGATQTPPTIIQNYPAPTATVAFPVRGSRFGFNGSPSWPVKSWHHGRRGGPSPHGPGHHPHGHQWNGGEHHRGGPPPHQGHHGPPHGGQHGGRPHHDQHGGYGGPPQHHGGGGHGGGPGAGHGGGGRHR